MRYRNTFGVAELNGGGGQFPGTGYNNPRRHHKRHRNPDLGKWLKPEHVVDGAIIATGIVGSEYFAKDVLKWDYQAPAGTSPDIMKVAQAFVARAAAGVIGAIALGAMHQQSAGEKVAAGAFASGVVSLLKNFGILNASGLPTALPSPAATVVVNPSGGAGLAALGSGYPLPAATRGQQYIRPVAGL